MTAKPTPTTILPGRLGVLGEAHDAGAIELPDKVVAAARRAAQLADAAKSAALAVADAERDLPQRRDIVAELIARGPSPEPGKALRAADLRLVELRDDRDIVLQASRSATTGVGHLTVAHASSIGERVGAALEEVLAAAEPDAPLLAGLAWSNPDALHDAPSDVAAAFHRLEPLAARFELILRSQVAMMKELTVTTTEINRRRAAPEFPIRVGLGIVGPATDRTAADYSMEWRWAPDTTTHPVARLAAAVAEAAAVPDVDRVDDVAESATA